MKKRPNILFLMTDHTNALSFAPGSQCITPNIDAIASEGTQFLRCYTTNAICSPARASLMTSLYPSTHGMWDCTHTQRTAWVDVPSARFTYFSNLLSDSGYRNGYFGKWHVEQSEKLENFGWHEYNIRESRLKRESDSTPLVTVKKEGYRDYELAALNVDTEERNHPAFENGIEFIRKSAKTDEPFCCFVSTIEPHDTYMPPNRFFDMYNLDAIKLSPSLHDDAKGKPEVIRRMQSVWSSMADDDWLKVTAAYYAVISYIDSQVGRIIEVLKETGQYDNTIIIFTSDHGDMLGAHGLVTKGIGTSYEEVYNIPLVIRVPGVTAGELDNESTVSLVDLAPTLLDLGGAPPIPDAQGRSLKPVLENTHNPSEWKEGYGEFFGQRFVYTQRIVWNDNWKYVFNPGGIDELYDLSEDPNEMDNLAEKAEHQDILNQMCKRMWHKMKKIGDNSLLNSQYATLRTAPIGPLSIDENRD